MKRYDENGVRVDTRLENIVDAVILGVGIVAVLLIGAAVAWYMGWIG